MEPLSDISTGRVRARWASLASPEAPARGPHEISRVLGELEVAPPIVDAVGAGLTSVCQAIEEAFPDNIFGDLDHLALSVAREAATRDDPVAHAQQALSTVASLMHLFGGETPIRFRYVHDFVYGYDWARWVHKDPESRSQIGPFDLAFLERMNRRGHELLTLIEEDDEEYPRLRDAEPRNPFGFSREPADERRLFRDLAARHLLPVEAWRFDAQPDWQRPFGELRDERARALGLS